ncbi:YkvA family protein [Rhodospirillum centenum]|uniref:DUF1232 domain-containing protein n=1 Tax=Rhodospirillum centenum (strain ATCC 51521 / SW) TaxID=414684 RepID=B6IUG6_RHOCS|nr:YkvA family protein [Rhodospirillum centenum]ACI99791.1 conserved hypothetical protein [Rhodospirillum centenum SW]
MSHTGPDSGPGAAFAEEALRIDPIKLERDRRLVLRQFWRKLRGTLARVPFVEDAAAAFNAATDPRTPPAAKAVLLGALAYFIAPIDFMPDFVALLGYTDDATVLMLALKTVRDNLRPEHYERARAWLADQGVERTDADEVADGPVIDHEPAAPGDGRDRPGPA